MEACAHPPQNSTDRGDVNPRDPCLKGIEWGIVFSVAAFYPASTGTAPSIWGFAYGEEADNIPLPMPQKTCIVSTQCGALHVLIAHRGRCELHQHCAGTIWRKLLQVNLPESPVPCAGFPAITGKTDIAPVRYNANINTLSISSQLCRADWTFMCNSGGENSDPLAIQEF